MKIDIRSYARNLSSEKFQGYGLDNLAYVRAVPADADDDTQAYIVYAADGSQISIMDSHEAAIAAIYINNLNPVMLN